MKKQIYLLILFVITLFCDVASAQVISTTAAFNFGTGSSASNASGFTTDNMVVSSNMNMPGGVYNFSSFTINSGVTVTVTGTAPLIIQCTGAVTISGVLTAAGSAGGSGTSSGGAGGGGGGVAGASGNAGGGANGVAGTAGSSYPGTSGGGKGGIVDGYCGFGACYAQSGSATNPNANCLTGSNNGVAYGNAALSLTYTPGTNILGGSGGGSGSGSGTGNGGVAPSGGGGGGGGGIAIIANSITITATTGLITVKGGNGGNAGNDLGGSGGGGSGGTVLLQYVTLSGTTTVNSTSTTTATNGIDISGGGPGVSTGGTLYTGGSGSYGYYLGQQACSGTPSTGAISATLSSVCASTTSGPSTSTLSLPSLSGSDYSFQWQVSATSGSGYANVASSGTSSTYTTPASLPYSPTSYYICNVTCANGGASTATAQQAISYNAFDYCYCKFSYSTTPAASKEITNVKLVGNTITLTNTPIQPSAAPEWVQNYSTNVPDLTLGQTYALLVTAGTSTKQNNTNAWIDFDQNGTFGDNVNEFIGATASFNGTVQQSFSFTVPATATPGQTALRVNYDNDGTTTTGFGTLTQAAALALGTPSYSPNTPCTFAGTVGSTYDFLVNIVGGCTAPTTQASSFVTDPSPTINSCNVTFTRGNGTGGMLVVCKAGSAPTPPASGTAYNSPNANITTGGISTTGTSSFVIYNSNSPSSGTVSVPATNLTPGTTYYFAAYEWNSASTCYTLTTVPSGTVAIPFCIPPTTKATSFAFSSLVPNGTSSTATVSFTRGNGNGGYMVLAKDGSAPSTGVPVQGTAYTTANSAYGTGGTALGDAYVVAASTTPGDGVSTASVNLTALTSGHSYYFTIYEFSTSNTACYTSALSGGFCIGAPLPITVSPASPVSLCPSTTQALSLTGLSAGGFYSYQWQSSSTSGSGYGNASGTSTSTTYTTPSTLPSSPVYYVCQVTCPDGGTLTTQSSEEKVSNLPFYGDCYCDAHFDYSSGNIGIAAVSLPGSTTNLAYVAPEVPNSTVGAIYVDWGYQSSPNPDIAVGTSYTVSVTNGSYGTEAIDVWIDWNQDGVFQVSPTDGLGLSELVASEKSVAANGVATFTFTVPSAALSGLTGMRVRAAYGTSGMGTTANVCNNYNSGSIAGETQDFVVNITSCSSPSTQASSFVTDPSPTTNSCNVMFTRGNGTGGMIVVCKAGSAPSIPTPGTAYSNPQANITAGGSTTASGSFVIYNSTTGSSGTQVTVPASGLTPGTTYYFAAYEWNSAANCYNLVGAPNGTVAIPICIQPTVQASGQSSSNVDPNNTTISWTGNGNGDGGVIVFVKKASAISTNPSETVAYTGVSAFQSGTQIASTGAYAVYTGIGSSVTVSNLITNTLYYYAIYAYNASSNCYMTPPVTGSFTSQNSPMSILSSTTTQSVVSSVLPNSSGNQIIGLQMVTSNGNSSGLSVTSITFNTNGSTNAADIVSATIYYTGTTSTFSATNPFGSAVTSFPGGSTPIVVTGSQSLTQNATNYFWIAYSIATTSVVTIGDVVDAEIPNFTAGSATTPSVTAPSGNRSIQLSYCNYSDPHNGYACSIGYIGIADVGIDVYNAPSPNTTNLYGVGATCAGAVYENFSSTSSYNVTAGSQYILTTTIFNTSLFPTYPATYTAYADWLNDGVFTDAGDQFWFPVTTNGSTTSSSFTFTVPSSTPGGSHRLRVVAYQNTTSNSCGNLGSFDAQAFDFTLNVTGCSSPPTVTITPSGSTTICGGGSANFTASGATSYLWSPASSLSFANVASPTAFPTATTTYTVTGSTGICSGTATVTITVNPSSISFSPSVPSISSPGGNVSVTASATSTNGSVSYSWSPSTGLNTTTGATVTASPLSTTTYTVTASDGVCSGTGTITVVVNSGTPGQVSCGYSWSKSNGSAFSLLSSPTILASGVNSTTDDAIYTSQPIGFNFDFNGITYSSLGVSTNGFVWFGSTNPATNEYNPISTFSAMQGVISVFGANLAGALTTSSCHGYTSSSIGDGTTSLSIQTSGTAPNRTFTIQWHSFKYATSSSSCSLGDYQILLHENGYAVDFKYNNNDYYIDDTFSGQVGIRGASNTDYNNRSVTCVSGVDWDDSSNPNHPGNSVAGTSSTSVCTIDGASCDLYPEQTLVWTWTPTLATPTITPSAQQNVCAGGSGVTLTANTTMSSPTYQWQTYTYPPSNTNISTQTGSSYLANPSSPGNYFYVVQVTNGSGCSRTSYATPVVATNCCTTPGAPTVGTITQPTCATSTGSVALSGLPSVAFTITASPGGATFTGNGTISSAFATGLAGNTTYTFTVSTGAGCTSGASGGAGINIAPVVPGVPSVGTITQPTCATSTASVALSGLPTTEAWTVTASPGGATFTGNGSLSTTNASGLAANTTYTFTVTDADGCTSGTSANAAVNAVPTCSFNYTITAFLQGYYLGGSTMSPLLYLLDPTHHSATDVDTVVVELHNGGTVYSTTNTTILQTNGTIVCNFPGAGLTGTYYIVVKHRNSITTWSASAQTLTSGGSYSFASGSGQAYGSTASLQDGNYAIYGGDVNQDGAINSSDMTQMQSVLSTFKVGVYNLNDITGDGFVDEDDYRILQNNITLGITATHP